MDVRGQAQVGGRPGAVVVAADGCLACVLDQASPRVAVLDPARMRLLHEASLAPAVGPLRSLGRHRDVVWLSPRSGALVPFRLASGTFGPAAGEGVTDLAFTADGGRASAVAVDAEGGVAWSLDERLRILQVLRLPAPPVPGTLAVCERLGLAAVLVRAGETASEHLVVWSQDPFQVVFVREVGGGAGALAFSGKQDLLYVARPRTGEVYAVDLPAGTVRRRVMILGRPFQLAAEPDGAGVWAVSEQVEHIARADLALGYGPAPVMLEGLSTAWTRLQFSPEGRLAALGESTRGHVMLLDMDPFSPTYGAPLDRIELGQELSGLAWSPVGDAIFVASPSGSVTLVTVDRRDLPRKDTAEYLRSVDPSRINNPLFPP